VSKISDVRGDAAAGNGVGGSSGGSASGGSASGGSASGGSARESFPFVAVVGQDEAKLALLLCAVDASIGGVLLTGDKGSAKTTLARGLAGLLPDGSPFVELPLGATEDRVVGSLDLKTVLASGGVEFSPGLLADANGGVLYVDEVNLLADHLVDILLDAAATGVNRVEREGISYEHPSRFVLVGSMNPEEGQLRPQLLDRFGLCVSVRASQDPLERVEAVRRRMEYEKDPSGFLARYDAESWELAGRLARAKPAALPEEVLAQAAQFCAAEGVASLRADLSACRAAAALAGLEGREVAEPEDLARVLPLVLSHRRRAHPLGSMGEGESGAGSAAARSAASSGAPRSAASSGAARSAAPEAAGSGRAQSGRVGAPRPDSGGSSAPRPDSGGSSAPRPDSGGAPSGIEPVMARADSMDVQGGSISAWSAPHSRTEGPGEGVGPKLRGILPRHGEVPSDLPSGERGTPAGPWLTQGTAALEARFGAGAEGFSGKGWAHAALSTGFPKGGLGPSKSLDSVSRYAQTQLAVVDTILASARRSQGIGQPPGRVRQGDSAGISLEPQDLRVRERLASPGRLVVVCLDLSGSTGLEERLEATRRWVLSFLLEAYRRRDKVALVSFRASDAQVDLAPTSSVEVAATRLEGMQTGGNTPLALGLERSLELIVGLRAQGDAREPWLVLVSDGKATHPGDPQQARSLALAAARKLKAAGVRSLVIDLEGGSGLGIGRDLANEMEGYWIPDFLGKR